MQKFPIIAAACLTLGILLPLAIAQQGNRAQPATAPHAPSATQPQAVAAALTAGKALALIEVTTIKEHDNRPADGNFTQTVTFKTLKSSGAIPDQISIIKAFGGMRTGPPPVPSGPLYPNPLVVAQRYWIVFNEDDFEKYQQGVVAWWPEKDAPAELDAAITAKKYDKSATTTATAK